MKSIKNFLVNFIYSACFFFGTAILGAPLWLRLVLSLVPWLPHVGTLATLIVSVWAIIESYSMPKSPLIWTFYACVLLEMLYFFVVNIRKHFVRKGTVGTVSEYITETFAEYTPIAAKIISWVLMISIVLMVLYGIYIEFYPPLF